MAARRSLQAATFTWGNPYYTKLSLATLGDKPPDVAVSHLTRAQNLAQANLLTPITDDMLALGGSQVRRLQPQGLGAQKLNGKSWVIPLDTHPFVMFYHSGICQKAGLLDADGKLKPIQGTQAWGVGARGRPESHRRLRRRLGQRRRLRHPLAPLPDPVLAAERCHAVHLGGGTKWTVNEDLATKTLEYIQKLSESEPAGADRRLRGRRDADVHREGGVLPRGTVGDHHGSGHQGPKVRHRANTPDLRQGRRSSRFTPSCCPGWIARRSR